jgi:hypothetical protein
MAQVTDIIDALCGYKAVAEKTGVPETTVHSWKRARYVPAWRIPSLLKLAAEMEKPLAAADFPASRPSDRKAA